VSLFQINSLVQQNVVPLNTPTTDICEYVAKVKIVDASEFFNLRIIDTPGYHNDVNMDSTLLTTLHTFLHSKQGLKTKYPTLVLIVIDIRSLTNHVGVKNLSAFLKVLAHYQDTFINKKFMNALFIVTHVLKPDDAETVKQLSVIVTAHAPSLPKPIYFIGANNKVHDRNNNDTFVPFQCVTLPNGRIFPNNVVERMVALLSQRGRDSIGETIIRTAFGPEYPNSIKPFSLARKVPLLAQDHPTVENTKRILRQVHLNIERTEISTLMEIGWENLDPKLKCVYESSLLATQKVLQAHNIKSFDELAELNPLKIQALLKDVPQNPATLDLLQETLQIQVPTCYAATGIGQSYDVRKDEWMNVFPFNFKTFKTSPAGKIPQTIECKEVDDRAIVFKFYGSQTDYIVDRLKDLHMKHSVADLSDSLTPTEGYNIVKMDQEPTKATVFTALVEYRNYRLTLVRNEEIAFKPQFWEALLSLPEINELDETNVRMWKEFFDYWGTHVVKSAFIGGKIRLTFRGQLLQKLFDSFRKECVLPSDEYETSRIFQWVTGDGFDLITNGNSKNFLKGYEEDVEAILVGGPEEFHHSDMTKLAPETVGTVRREWIVGLQSNPVVLSGSMVLAPLSYYVREKCVNSARKMDTAFHYFYTHFLDEQKHSSCNLL